MEDNYSCLVYPQLNISVEKIGILFFSCRKLFEGFNLNANHLIKLFLIVESMNTPLSMK